MKLPLDPPAFQTLLDELAKQPTAVSRVFGASINPAPGGRYRHWHKLRFLPPPQGFSHEEWWLAIKLARTALLKPLPLIGSNGHPFQVGMPDPLLEMVHGIDRDASGRIEISEQVTNPATRDRYLVSSLIDEAITSSQLEGAATTYKVAKDMIRSGRPPHNRNERMIFNNYRAMQHVRTLTGEPLTIERVFHLHRLLTMDTLDDSSAAGRFRTSDEGILVRDARDNTVLHTPPPATELPARMQLMCDFANASVPDYYLHPVVRAVLLHFWLAYEHPFVDGNGRTARALFYWSMLRQGYWLCEYLSISSIMRKAPGMYMRAYLYSESDDLDATYFVLFHLRVIRLAIRQLHDYLRTQMNELRQAEKLMRSMDYLNHRQLAVLSHALRHPDARYSIESHRGSHGIVYQTARTDLLTLVSKGLLEQRRTGKRYIFLPPADLAERVGSS